MAATDPERAERLAYSVREATKITGASRDALYDAIKRGDLACVRIGGRMLLRRVTLDQYLAAHEAKEVARDVITPSPPGDQPHASGEVLGDPAQAGGPRDH